MYKHVLYVNYTASAAVWVSFIVIKSR